jgi:hypothetical protein
VRNSLHLVIERMGMGTLIFGKSESQESKGEEGKFVWRKGAILDFYFLATREEFSD